MQTCERGFRPLLGTFDVEALERRADAAWGLWPDLTLAYANPAWHAFALANGGGRDFERRWGLGRSVLDACGGPLRSFYLEHLSVCLRGSRTWTHDYECSSPHRFRRYRMQVHPLREARGLLVETTLLVEHAIDLTQRAPMPPDEHHYLDDNGLIVQCVHCRRVRRVDDEERWDWVPSWVARTPSNASGALCGPCLNLHFPPHVAQAAREAAG